MANQQDKTVKIQLVRSPIGTKQSHRDTVRGLGLRKLNSVSELQDTLGRLQRSGASSEEALAEAQRQAEALGVLTGTLPATGPGVEITIEDPDGGIPPEVMLDALQELRNAGAEVMASGRIPVADVIATLDNLESANA